MHPIKIYINKQIGHMCDVIDIQGKSQTDKTMRLIKIHTEKRTYRKKK